MTEAYAQILPNSTGDKVRVVRNTVAGNLVDQQVVAIANERGALLPTDELLTAFGSLRVAAPRTLFDSKLLTDKQPLFWAEALTGAGSSSQASSVVTMGVTSGTDSATRQTKMWFNYQAGKSQLILLTGVFSQQTNVTKRAGYFNGADGIYLKVTGSAVAFEILKGSSVSESVAQASWNLDTLDSSGPSGVMLNLSNAQIVVIDFQWLGTGTVRVGFIIGGRLIYAHAFHHANLAGTPPYMATPNLPVRYDITSTGGAGTMVQICSTVISEGGNEDRGLIYAVDSGLTPFAVPAGAGALIAVRLTSTKLGATVIPLNVDLLLTNVNTAARWSLLLNPAIAGAALSYSALTNTSIDVALGAATNTCTGGTELDAGYIGPGTRTAAAALISTLRLGSDLAATQDVLVLALAAVTGSPNIVGALRFQEML